MGMLNEDSEPKFDYQAADHTAQQDTNTLMQQILAELEKMNKVLVKLERKTSNV